MTFAQINGAQGELWNPAMTMLYYSDEDLYVMVWWLGGIDRRWTSADVGGRSANGTEFQRRVMLYIGMTFEWRLTSADVGPKCHIPNALLLSLPDAVRIPQITSFPVGGPYSVWLLIHGGNGNFIWLASCARRLASGDGSKKLTKARRVVICYFVPNICMWQFMCLRGGFRAIQIRRWAYHAGLYFMFIVPVLCFFSCQVNCHPYLYFFYLITIYIWTSGLHCALYFVTNIVYISHNFHDLHILHNCCHGLWFVILVIVLCVCQLSFAGSLLNYYYIFIYLKSSSFIFILLYFLPSLLELPGGNSLVLGGVSGEIHLSWPPMPKLCNLSFARFICSARGHLVQVYPLLTIFLILLFYYLTNIFYRY